MIEDWVSIGSASVIGSSHLQSGGECEDAFYVKRSLDNKWCSIVLCDGAGSASKSKEAAVLVSKYFAECLIELSEKLEFDKKISINDYIFLKIIDIRDMLRNTANSVDLSDYHCTLVAVLFNSEIGLSIHIGDGIILSGSDTEFNFCINENSHDQFISKPHNGEFSNETFFVTEKDWIKNLRINVFPKFNWLAIATDGGSEFIAEHNSSPSRILKDTFNLLRLNKFKNSNIILEDMLSSKEFSHITGDDKTIVIAMKNDFIENGKSDLNYEAGVYQYNNSELVEEHHEPIKNTTLKTLISMFRILYKRKNQKQ